MSAQAKLGYFEPPLTPAERAIYEASLDQGDMSVCEYVSRQGWDSPGTVSNLLQRARRKLGETGGQDSM